MADKTIGDRVAEAKDSVSDYVTRGLTSALEVYIDTLMKRPTWADIVITLEDIKVNLLDDFKSNVVRSFALSLFSKLGVADQDELAANMAAYLVKSHPSWFPLYGKSEKGESDQANQDASSETLSQEKKDEPDSTKSED